MADCILYQSAINAAGLPVQQLSNLSLTGLTTINSFLNSDNGKLYGSFSAPSGVYSLSLYSDAAQTALVASGTSSAAGQMTLTAANSSGISGTVNVVQFVANDANLQAICFLSTDNDLPMDYLSTVPDYDPVLGFSNFHNIAFQQVKTKIVSRFESFLWNETQVDSRQINGGLGGFDLSRILSWSTSDFVEMSAQYALYLICRKQGVEPDGDFAKRAKCAYEKFTALMESVEVSFDLNLTRVPRRTKNTSSFRISRA
jgi:hypothetical protein